MPNDRSMGYQAGRELARQFKTSQRAAAPQMPPLGPESLTPEEGARGREELRREILPAMLRTAPGVAPPLIGAPLSAAGETAAQLMESGEITSPTQIGVAAAVPPAVAGAGRAAMAGVRAIGRHLPGAAAALQEEAVKVARALPAGFAPRTRAEVLFGQLERLNPRITTPHLSGAVNELLRVERGLPSGLEGGQLRVLEGLRAFMDDHAGEVPFQQLRDTLRRVGERTGSVQGLEATEMRGAFKRLTQAMHEDLEAAARIGGKKGQAASLLKQANAAFRKERAVDDLAEIIEGAVNKGRSDLLESFNAARALKALDENDFLRKSFTAQELTEIRTVIRGLKGLPSLPPPSGESAIGSGRVLARLLSGGAVGGGVAEALGGGHLGGALGMALGITGTQVTHQAVARLLSTSRGRQSLLRLVHAHDGVLDRRVLSTLLQSARAQLSAVPSEPSGEAR